MLYFAFSISSPLVSIQKSLENGPFKHLPVRYFYTYSDANTASAAVLPSSPARGLKSSAPHHAAGSTWDGFSLSPSAGIWCSPPKQLQRSLPPGIHALV